MVFSQGFFLLLSCRFLFLDDKLFSDFVIERFDRLQEVWDEDV